LGIDPWGFPQAVDVHQLDVLEVMCLSQHRVHQREWHRGSAANENPASRPDQVRPCILIQGFHVGMLADARHRPNQINAVFEPELRNFNGRAAFENH
jgi:hypothetical protein